MAAGPVDAGVFGSKYRTERYVSVLLMPDGNRTASDDRSGRAIAIELFVVPKSSPIPRRIIFHHAAWDEDSSKVSGFGDYLISEIGNPKIGQFLHFRSDTRDFELDV